MLMTGIQNVLWLDTVHSKPLLHFMGMLDAYILLTTAYRSTTTKRKYIVAFT